MAALGCWLPHEEAALQMSLAVEGGLRFSVPLLPSFDHLGPAGIPSPLQETKEGTYQLRVAYKIAPVPHDIETNMQLSAEY